MRLIQSFLIAFATYSRIPMPRADWSDENRRYAMCFFPLIGAVIGGVLALWLFLCGLLGIGGFLKGAVGACIPLLITGGIHMDGFMDTCDAMASWQDTQRRLEILKDSHTGAFAVIGCCVYMLLSAAVIAEADMSRMLPMGVCFIASRLMSAVTLTSFKSARPNGMLDGFARTAAGKAVHGAAAVYLAACVVCWMTAGVRVGLLSVLTLAVCLLVYRRRCYKYFGGVTGDLAGWFVQISEFCMLTVVVLGEKLL